MELTMDRTVDKDEDPQVADARRQLLTIEAEIQNTGRDYHRIVTEGANHFGELHQRAMQHLDEDNIDEFVQQGAALAHMQDRHTLNASRYAPTSTKP
jgi:hypothetical protein